MTGGRFAPSPTGPLHLGSLLAATASYLDARSSGATWRLRIDDLDTPRNQPGATALILEALDCHGLHWDGTVQYQSNQIERYQQALDSLAERCFYCRCSRRALAGQHVYPGNCRGYTQPRADSAIRIRVDATPISFDDLLMGPQVDVLCDSVGDFIIRRRDGLIAYQLATAVDDGSPEITRVVRGRDLLDNTSRQIFLIQLLGGSIPEYAHIPTLTYPNGQKLSKQHGAPGVDNRVAGENLHLVLSTLQMKPPQELSGAAPAEILDWAIEAWQLTNLPVIDQVLET